jgi:hypothetical protein
MKTTEQEESDSENDSRIVLENLSEIEAEDEVFAQFNTFLTIIFLYFVHLMSKSESSWVLGFTVKLIKSNSKTFFVFRTAKDDKIEVNLSKKKQPFLSENSNWIWMFIKQIGALFVFGLVTCETSPQHMYSKRMPLLWSGVERRKQHLGTLWSFSRQQWDHQHSTWQIWGKKGFRSNCYFPCFF